MPDAIVLVGWVLLLCSSVAVARALVLARVRSARAALAAQAASLAVLAIGYGLERPLDAQQLPFALAWGLIVVAVATSGVSPARPALPAVASAAAASLAAQAVLGLRPDVPSLVLTAAMIAAPSLAAALALVRSSGLPVPGRAGAWAAALAGLAAAAGARMCLDFADAGTLTLARAAMAAAPAAASAVLLVPWSQRAARRAVALLVACCVALSASPAVLAATRPAAEPTGLVTAEQVRKAQYAGLITMDEEAGAGPKDEYRGKSFAECDAIGARDCFITFYDDLAMRKGVLAAVTDLITRVDNNEGQTFPQHCHQVVHNLGQLSFELTDGFTEATVVDPQTCATGFTHGLWEQKFGSLGPEVVFTNVSHLCRTLIPVSDLYQWSCSHILGHAMVNWMMHDPSHATDYCTAIVEYDDRFNCNVGGWMNYFTDQTVLAQFTEYGSVQDVFAVCYGAKEGLHKYLCYQEIFPAVYLQLGDSDFLAGQACMTMSEPTARPGVHRWDPDALSYSERCVEGMARGVAVLSQYDYRVAVAHCNYYPDAAIDGCLAAAASSIALNTGSVEASNRVCQNIKETAYKNYCYQWSKSTRALLASGPNMVNLPPPGVIRLPAGARALLEQ